MLVPKNGGGPYPNGILLDFEFNYSINGKGTDYDAMITIDPSETTRTEVNRGDGIIAKIPKTNSSKWYIRDGGFRGTGAPLGQHEVGHLFGLPDEYVGPNTKYPNEKSLPPDSRKSIMGSADPTGGGKVLPRNVDQIIIDNGLANNKLKGWLQGGPYNYVPLTGKTGKDRLPGGNLIPLGKPK